MNAVRDIDAIDRADEILISVCMITYRHEEFIAHAIEGVLAQEQLPGPMELVISDDFSPDGTREICLDYQRRYPDRVRLLLPESNLGMNMNFIQTLAACRGQYIALCEGDDYWTDPLKLQKQVDFLEANPEFVLCFHPVTVKRTHEPGSADTLFPTGLGKDEFTTVDILGPWFIPTASIVFRRPEPFELPHWMRQTMSGDIPLLLLLSLQGRFKMLSEVMGVYRLNQGGLSLKHRGYDKVRGMAHMYELFNAHTEFRYNARVREAFIAEVNAHLPEVQELRIERARFAEKVRELEARELPLSRKVYYFLWNHVRWLRPLLK